MKTLVSLLHCIQMEDYSKHWSYFLLSLHFFLIQTLPVSLNPSNAVSFLFRLHSFSIPFLLELDENVCWICSGLSNL